MERGFVACLSCLAGATSRHAGAHCQYGNCQPHRDVPNDRHVSHPLLHALWPLDIATGGCDRGCLSSRIGNLTRKSSHRVRKSAAFEVFPLWKARCLYHKLALGTKVNVLIRALIPHFVLAPGAASAILVAGTKVWGRESHAVRYVCHVAVEVQDSRVSTRKLGVR